MEARSIDEIQATRAGNTNPNGTASGASHSEMVQTFSCNQNPDSRSRAIFRTSSGSWAK
jgi:hypothetical protein